MAHEPKVVAGLSCLDVLARLSELVDGEVSADERAQMAAHVAACDWCDRFGREFAATLDALRAEAAAPPVPTEVGERLLARLAGQAPRV